MSVRDRSEDLWKIKHADGFELNGVGVLQMRACKWIGVKILWSSGMPTRLSFGSLSQVLDLTMKKGVGLPCTNWSGVGAALLMSPRQGETSQYEGMCGVAGWVSNKCPCETAARAAPLRERVGL